MTLSPEEQRLLRMFRGLDDFARNTVMVSLGKEMMERYAVNIGVTLCESDRLAQQRTELSDEMRHQHEERLWAARPPLLHEGTDISMVLSPRISALPVFDIIFGYPWGSSDDELVEFLADELFGVRATSSQVSSVRNWLDEWREKVFTAIELQSNP